MTVIKFSFDQDEMLQLTNEQFLQLSSFGETSTGVTPAKDYSIDDEYSRICLSYNGSLSSYYFEFNPVEDIEKFIKNSYFTLFFPKTGKVKLIDRIDQTLSIVLEKKLIENENNLIVRKDDFVNGQNLFDDELVHNSVQTLIATGKFKGQISCCGCGIAGCSSEYLWAEDYLGLISFKIVAARLQVVSLYPFKLV